MLLDWAPLENQARAAKVAEGTQFSDCNVRSYSQELARRWMNQWSRGVGGLCVSGVFSNFAHSVGRNCLH